MTTLKLHSKLVAALLMVAFFCAACDVPDISEFTRQSAEMTRGIRKGVKDTENVIKTAAVRDDLFSDNTRAALEQNLKNYQESVKPTNAALDALDAYLEALNALAQANKKSGENAAALVTSVGNLVNAVSGLTFASSVVNVATGLGTLLEKFRTAKDFKKRVNLAAEIVEGRYDEKRDSSGNIVADEKGKPVMVKACGGDAEDQVTVAGQTIKELLSRILKDPNLTEDYIKALKKLSPREQREQLIADRKMTENEGQTVKAAETKIASFGCGVIDFIKFNVKDLKTINLAVSAEMFTNAREKNRVILGFYENIVANDRRIQNALDRILDYKALIPRINEQVANNADLQAVKSKITLKNTLTSIFMLDSEIETAVLKALRGCPDCGQMLTVVQTLTDRAHCDATCRHNLEVMLQNTTRDEFNKTNSLIEQILDTKAIVLFDQNERYLTELARIRPFYESVGAELKSMKDKQDQLDALLDSSLRALDTWARTHANLRVAVNTKRPLTVSNLASSVREIWSIVNPESK